MFDLINIMQGVIIFVVFVCRRAVLIRLCEVLCGMNYAKEKFPKYYQNADVDLPNNEIKHSVIWKVKQDCKYITQKQRRQIYYCTKAEAKNTLTDEGVDGSARYP